MTKSLTNDQIADRVATRIDAALHRNRLTELTTVVVLVLFAGVGLSLLIFGAYAMRWDLLVSGTACQVAVGWPISKLIDMRRSNVLLQILPELIRAADSQDRKKLLYDLVARLTAQM